MSKRISILVLSIAVLVSAWLWLRTSANVEIDAPPSVGRVLAQSPPVAPSALPPPSAIAEPEASAREIALAPEAAKPIEAKHDMCILFGRAADENDQALSGVVVRVAAYKVWTEGVEVPRLPGKIDMRGYEMTTGDDGVFRFEGPVPTAESPWLTLEPDPFHDSARLILGGKRPEAKPPLHAGDNDFGTIRLTTTGAIRGSVRDEAGAPIAEAKLVLGPERSYTLDRDALSDAAGNFVVAHSPAGPMGLNAQAEGYLSEFRKPIDVTLGRYTDNVDFVLRKAPTLSGITVDDAGRPIEGVEFVGWPKSSGAGAVGKSLADGTFAVALPQDESYSLEATREGFESFGVHNRTTQYAPGTQNLRIVMKRLESSTLLVIDAGTSQPITKFGIEMLPNMSDHAPHSSYTDVRSPPVVEHPDGRAMVSFRPGIDAVDVSARGYEPQRFDPKPGAPEDGLFVVKLVPTASVFGRVRVAGVLSGGVALRLEAGQMQSGSPASKWAADHFAADTDGTILSTSTPDGSFRFENTPRGTFRLVARAASGEAACVDPFMVAASSAIDLGTIDLVPGAVLRGVVLVPAGRRQAGLTLRLDHRWAGESQVTDADGRFEFVALIPGAHQIHLPEVPGSIGMFTPLEVQLQAGEVREVQIDARECGTCSVDLTILLGGRPAANAQVSLLGDGGRKSLELGKTNREGRLETSAPLGSGLGVSLWTADRVQLKHPTARLDLTLDAKIVETIRFDTANVVLVLPQSLVLPAKCSLSFVLTPTGGAATGSTWRSLNLADGVTQDSGVTANESGRRLQFSDLIAGDWQFVFDVSDAADPVERVQLTANSWETHRKTMYSATGAFIVTSGQTVTVELR